MKIKFIENFAGIGAGSEVESFEAGKEYDFIDTAKAQGFIRARVAQEIKPKHEPTKAKKE